MAKRIYKREPKISLLQQKFGDLTVVSYDPSVIKRNRSTWLCECSCGNKTNKLTSELVSGFAKSCGCHIKLNPLGSHEKIGNLYRKTKELKAWYGMKNRCYNKNNPSYENYGGKGIEVCKEWLNSFFTFLNDMGKAPSKNHSIDRIDVLGNYTKENCRWATNKEQQNNKTDNLKVIFDGETYSGSMFCDIFKIPEDFFRKRFANGESPEFILEQSEKAKRLGIKNFSSKSVIQYDLNGNFIKKWPSITEASRFLNLKHPNYLARAIRKNREMGGYAWELREN